MGRRGAVAAVICLLVQVCVVAGAEARSESTIRLTGSGNTYVDVRFENPVRLVCCEFKLNDEARCCASQDFTVETEGTYAGYAIERLGDRKVIVGGVRIPDMDLNGVVPMVGTLAPGGVIRPGLYRLYLISDGPTVIRIRAQGLPSNLALSPRHPADVQGKLLPLGLGAVAPVAHGRRAIDVSRRSSVLVASHIESDGGQINYLNHCVVPEGELCQLNDRDQQTEVFPCPGCGASGISIAKTYRQGSLPAWKQEAAFTASSAGVVRVSQGFVLVLN